MIKKIVIFGVVLLFITLMIYLYEFTPLYKLNQPINELVKGKPDKQCKSNSDCEIKHVGCDAFCSTEAVNTRWEMFCPIPDRYAMKVSCSYAPGIKDINAICQNNICTEEIVYSDTQDTLPSSPSALPKPQL